MTVAAPVKDYLKTWCEETIRADFAEKIATIIENSIRSCPRAPQCSDQFCWTCHDVITAKATAAMIRREGGVL